MIVVRDTFQIRFGQTGAALELWRQILPIIRKLGHGGKDARILTDLVGSPFYSLVLERTYESLAQYEQGLKDVLGNAEFRAVYGKLVPLVESGRREIFKVVE